jgi:hypothetical protein
VRSLAALGVLVSACGIIAGLEDKELPKARVSGGDAGKGSGGTSGSGTGESGTSGQGGAGDAGAGDSGGTAGSSRGGGAGAGRGGIGASGGQGGSAASAGVAGSGASGGTANVDCYDLPRDVEVNLSVGPGCVRVVGTSVKASATLTIAPGTTVLMESGGFLDTLGNGLLIGVGTAESPILFTSAAAIPAPGDWRCVRLAGARQSSAVRHAIFEYGGAPCDASGAHHEGMLQITTRTSAVSDSIFRSSLTHGVLIETDGQVDEFRDNVFEDNAAASIDIAAPQLLRLGEGLTFVDADDRIDVNTTFGLRTSGTWRAQSVPFRLGLGLELGQADVTIAPGTRIELTGSSIMVFDSNLVVAGTEEAPVTFTSGLEPQAAGDWGCITFSASPPPRFDHAVFEYAGNGQLCSGAEHETALHVPEGTVITNTTFREIAGYAVTSTDCNVTEWCENSFESVELGPLACTDPTACP